MNAASYSLQQLIICKQWTRLLECHLWLQTVFKFNSSELPGARLSESVLRDFILLMLSESQLSLGSNAYFSFLNLICDEYYKIISLETFPSLLRSSIRLSKLGVASKAISSIRSHPVWIPHLHEPFLECVALHSLPTIFSNYLPPSSNSPTSSKFFERTDVKSFLLGDLKLQKNNSHDILMPLSISNCGIWMRATRFLGTDHMNRLLESIPAKYRDMTATVPLLNYPKLSLSFPTSDNIDSSHSRTSLFLGHILSSILLPQSSFRNSALEKWFSLCQTGSCENLMSQLEKFNIAKKRLVSSVICPEDPVLGRALAAIELAYHRLYAKEHGGKACAEKDLVPFDNLCFDTLYADLLSYFTNNGRPLLGIKMYLFLRENLSSASFEKLMSLEHVRLNCFSLFVQTNSFGLLREILVAIKRKQGKMTRESPLAVHNQIIINANSIIRWIESAKPFSDVDSVDDLLIHIPNDSARYLVSSANKGTANIGPNREALLESPVLPATIRKRLLLPEKWLELKEDFLKCFFDKGLKNTMPRHFDRYF